METKKSSLTDYKNDPAYRRWIDPITKKATRWTYGNLFKNYVEWTGKTPTELIDEAVEDMKKDPREREDIVLRRLTEFYNYLKTKYPVKGRGNIKRDRPIIRYGLSDNLANSHITTARSFYATFGITVKMKGRYRLPKPKTENKRIIFKPEDVWKVKVLVDHARTPRDRALVLSHFQGGMDVSTLCSVNYGVVADGLAKDEHPLKVDLQRPKTGVEYYTFLGKDAIDALKAYLADMKSRGVKFENKNPLFVQERGKGRLRTHNVQAMMKDLAVRSGFVSEENNGYDFNPLGSQSLRESFGSLMTNSGVPDTVVDFWLGHEVGAMAEAYKTVQYESLRKMYLERENLLSIAPKTDVEEIKTKIEKEVDQKSKQLQSIVNGVISENLSLKEGMRTLTKRIESLEHLFDKDLGLSPEEYGKIVSMVLDAKEEKEKAENLRKAKEAWKKED